MQPVNLFKLATQQAQWLSVRQTAVAGNIANVHTPNYLAKDVTPFESVLSKKLVTLAATQPGHVMPSPVAAATFEMNQDDGAIMPSGNSVVLEDELMKAGEVKRSFELNTAIVRSFHRMMMMTSRG